MRERERGEGGCVSKRKEGRSSRYLRVPTPPAPPPFSQLQLELQLHFRLLLLLVSLVTSHSFAACTHVHLPLPASAHLTYTYTYSQHSTSTTAQTLAHSDPLPLLARTWRAVSNWQLVPCANPADLPAFLPSTPQELIELYSIDIILILFHSLQLSMLINCFLLGRSVAISLCLECSGLVK